MKQYQIVADFSAHGFQIGEIVYIVQDDADGVPRVSNGKRSEFLIARDIVEVRG